MPTPRDNQAWLADLRASGEQRDSALVDLSATLRRILPGALARWLSPEAGQFDAFLEDIIQETLMRVLDRLDSFEGRSQFTTWVYKIAIRISLNELRHRKWKEVSLDGLEEGNEPQEMPSERFASSDPHPESALERKDAMELVKRIFEEELTPRQRAAMMARSEEHTSELQSPTNLVCRLLLEKKKKTKQIVRNQINKKAEHNSSYKRSQE